MGSKSSAGHTQSPCGKHKKNVCCQHYGQQKTNMCSEKPWSQWVRKWQNLPNLLNNYCNKTKAVFAANNLDYIMSVSYSMLAKSLSDVFPRMESFPMAWWWHYGPEGNEEGLEPSRCWGPLNRSDFFCACEIIRANFTILSILQCIFKKTGLWYMNATNTQTSGVLMYCAYWQNQDTCFQ